MYRKDQAALTPPLGWNSWDCYGPAVNEEQLLGNAQYMADHLKAHGWEYVVCDIQWYEPEAGKYHWEYNRFAQLCMDEYGRLMPAVNRFPSAADGAGFKPIADRIHAMGLKFGIHIMRGVPRLAVHNRLKVKGTDISCHEIAHRNSICAWNTDMYGVDADKPGAQAYYDSIFALYADWGVDYVKVDDICNVKATPLEEYSARREIEMISTAIDRSGRSMVLSLSPGPAVIGEAWHMAKYANMWRITDDFWDNWPSLLEMFWRCEVWQAHVQPGRYPDCDMLPLGRIAITADGKGHYTNFTKPEQITMMSLWGIFRAPLIMGGEMRDNNEFTLSLLTNDEMLRLNQHGGTPLQLFRDEEKAAWLNFVGDVPYVALFNLREAPATVSADLTELVGGAAYTAEELWTKEASDVQGTISAEIEPHGARLYKLTEKGR